jgi:glycerate kinase
LVAPDKFKGTLSAAEVAQAVARGLDRTGISADICRIADGGDGTIDVLGDAETIEIVDADVHDALGRPVTGRVALLDAGRRALVEVADAIGMAMLGESELDPLKASSRGAGELIAAAARAGAKEVFVAVGGTATVDGGAGALDVLREARLLNKRGRAAKAPKITVLCDVRASWDQAAPVFAPQKGADAAAVKKLIEWLDTIAEKLPRDPRGVMLTGAGGGLSGGLWAAAGADLKSGAAFVLDRLGFNARMTTARAVITGEGRLDHQTLLGKAVGEVATRARQLGVPCHAIVGQRQMTEFEGRILDFETISEAGTARSIANAAERLGPVLARR